MWIYLTGVTRVRVEFDPDFDFTDEFGMDAFGRVEAR